MCEIALYILNSIWLILSFACIMIIIFGIIIHAIDFKRNKKGGSRILFISSIVYGIFALFNVLIYFIQALTWISTCNEYNQSFLRWGLLAQVLQSFMVLVTLFTRSYFVFKGSVYNLSRWTITAYCVSFSLLLLMALIVLVFPFEDVFGEERSDGIAVAMIALCFLIYALLCVSIAGLFIFKLFQLHKTVNKRDGENARFSTTSKDENDRFIALITKNTVLAFVATMTTVLTLASVITIPDKPTNSKFKKAYIRHYLFLLDAFINFVCIKLAYRVFQGYYYKICGPLDRKGKWCCYKLTGSRHRNNEQQLVKMMNTNNDDQDDKKEA